MQQSPRTPLRSIRFPLLFIYLLLSLGAAAQSLFVRPAGPTTRTPVTITYFSDCAPASTMVSVADKRIRIQLELRGCGEPPFVNAFDVPVPGLLPAGEYTVELLGNQSPLPSLTFIVRDAEPRPLTVTPFAIPWTQLAPVRARVSAGNSQFEPLCSPGNTCRVYVDGVEAANVRVDEEGDLWFSPPFLSSGGLKSVAVDNANLRREVPNAVYYFNPSGTPNRSIFERVLFPLLTELPGANGSRWITETTISNPRRAYVETWNDIAPFQCIDYPCFERLAPGQLVKFEGGEYPRGVALLTPWSESPYLSFGLRARDTSRAAEGYGTEVPVVRESEMFTGTEIALLNVPLQTGYRAKLRVYAFDLSPYIGASAVTRIVRANGASASIGVELARDCSGVSCHAIPYYGEADLPAGAGVADVMVRVTAPAQAWAFITVTNDETQQVTLVTPNGQGRGRCDAEGCGGDR